MTKTLGSDTLRLAELLAADNFKVSLCIRIAKADSLNYRETKDKRFLSLRKEAMNDARYWKSQLTA